LPVPAGCTTRQEQAFISYITHILVFQERML